MRGAFPTSPDASQEELMAYHYLLHHQGRELQKMQRQLEERRRWADESSQQLDERRRQADLSS
jgi:hypothetical protein